MHAGIEGADHWPKRSQDKSNSPAPDDTEEVLKQYRGELKQPRRPNWMVRHGAWSARPSWFPTTFLTRLATQGISL